MLTSALNFLYRWSMPDLAGNFYVVNFKYLSIIMPKIIQHNLKICSPCRNKDFFFKQYVLITLT